MVNIYKYHVTIINKIFLRIRSTRCDLSKVLNSIGLVYMEHRAM